MCVCSVAQLWPFQHLFQKLGNNGAWFSGVAGDEHKWIQQKPTNSFSNAKRSLWFSVVQPASPNIMISAARASEPYCRSPDFLSCGMVCTPQSNDEIIGRIQGPKDLFDHVQIDPASLKLPHIIRYDSKTQLLTKLVWFLHNLLELLAQKKAAAVDSSVEGWTYDLWRITLKLRQVLSCCLAGQHWEVGFIHLILLLRPPVACKLPEDILAGDGHKFRGLSFIIGIDTSGVT